MLFISPCLDKGVGGHLFSLAIFAAWIRSQDGVSLAHTGLKKRPVA